MRKTLLALLTACLWHLAEDLHASNRYFSDLEAGSPDGRFRVEAKSPDNTKPGDEKTGPWPTPFQGNFMYRFFDQKQLVASWSRKQKMKEGGILPVEGPPAALYVSNDGWVVIRTEDLGTRAELIAVAPAGRDRLRVDILKELVRGEKVYQEYVIVGSAGEHWGEAYCHPYFISISGKPYFCLTTWWGKRLLVDLDGGQVVQDHSALEPMLATAEENFVVSSLSATRRWNYDLQPKVNPGLAEGSPGPDVNSVIGAILIAGRLKLHQAIPLIQELESCPIVLTTVGGQSRYVAPHDGVEPAVYQNLTVRQTAQLSLRRLGIRPSTHQATKLYRADNYWQPQDPLLFEREKRVGNLKPAMSPEQVLEIIGAPDFVTNDGWEYDLDGEGPCTLIIPWEARGCGNAKNVSLPKWREGAERDRELTR